MSPRQPSQTFSLFLPVLLCIVLMAGCNLPAKITPTVTLLPSYTPQLLQDTPTTLLPTLTAQPTATPLPAPLNIVFTTGTTEAIQPGTFQLGQNQSYSLSAGQNQPMILILDSPNNDLYLAVTEPNGNKLLDPANRWNRWQWLLPKTEVYTIQVFGGASTENYTLTVRVVQLVNFTSGLSSTTLNGTTVNGYVFSYAVYCNAGQTMTTTLNVPSSTAYLDVFGLATGPLLSPSAKANTWSGILPSTQDYVIEVFPNNGQAVNYSLTVSCH